MSACDVLGLFRTQLADGIMGLAIADDTLPIVLAKAGVTSTKIFSLCFRVGGGTCRSFSKQLINLTSSFLMF
jgi:hypothetical protein